MFLKKMTLTLAFVALLAFLVLNACAQLSSGGTVVYMGDLNLAGNVGQSESGAYVIGSMASQGSSGGLSSSSNQLTNDVTVSNSSMDNASLDNSSINNASMNAASTMGPQTIAVLDLSSYAKDRVKGDLTGYTNIMYPFAESKGSTTSTAGGGGGCGGCS
jgi:hypothetical protein